MRPPHLHVCRAALLVLLLAGGCASDATTPEPTEPQPPSFEPIVWEHAEDPRGAERDRQDRRPLEGDAAGWSDKLALARRYVAGGYDEEALQILDGALTQHPPEPWAGRLRALKRSVEVRRAQERLLRVEARGTRDYVTFGAPVDFVVRLRNVSGETVTLLAPDAAGGEVSPSALQIDISRRDRDIHATELRRTWNRTVYLQEAGGEPIRIPPGGVHEIPVRIPAEAAGPAIAGLRTLEISGTLRPTRLRKGSEPRTVRLPIRPGRVMALPRGFEPLTVDPLKSMATAVETVAPAHLLIASEFVPPGRRPDAVAILARALGRGHAALYRAALGGLALLRERAVGAPVGPLVKPLLDELAASPGRGAQLMEGLSTLTGVRLAPDPRLWQDWWRREENRRKAVTAATTGRT